LKQIIVITGTPGVGKTSVSERLAANLGAFHIDLADLVKRERLSSGYNRQRRTLLADTDELTKRVQQIVTQNRGDVIIDGHYATSVVSKREVSRVFVLRCHPQQLKQQMEKRGFKGAKLWENLAAEILDVCLYDAIKEMGPEKICEIDVTKKTVDETVEEIAAILRCDKECMVGIIDWLGKLEEESVLDQYLKEF
jgi:adenylate kinase